MEEKYRKFWTWLKQNPEVKEITDRIINKHGGAGIEDFRDLYEKHKNI